MRTKHQSIRIRKKFRKNPPYRCCYPPVGNPTKHSGGYCCTYPQLYRRRDIKVANEQLCREIQSSKYDD